MNNDKTESTKIGLLLICPLVCSLIVTVSATLWELNVINTSKSSTAAIGYIFLPLYSFVFAVISFMIFWSLIYVARFIIERIWHFSERMTTAVPFCAAILLLIVLAIIVQEQVVRHRLLNTASTAADMNKLTEILDSGIAYNDTAIVVKLVENSNTPKEYLTKIYDFCENHVPRSSGEYYEILHALSRNHQTPADILAKLAESRHLSIRIAVASNPGVSIDTLQQLANDGNQLVNFYAKRTLQYKEKNSR